VINCFGGHTGNEPDATRLFTGCATDKAESRRWYSYVVAPTYPLMRSGWLRNTPPCLWRVAAV